MSGERPVTEQMNRLIDAWRSAGDRREIFLSCYAMMTANMLDAVEARQFEDSPWVASLLHRFADYYFDALAAYERDPASAPAVWRVAFNATRSPRTHVLQNLSLGVNAHINYDLAFALTDLLATEWPALSSSQRESRYRDHCRINDIIYQTTDAVQDQVIERHDPALDLVDRLMGPLDEWLTSRLIGAWREQVWHSAARLLQCQAEADRSLEMQEIEQRSLERARTILGPPGLTGLL